MNAITRLDENQFAAAYAFAAAPARWALERHDWKAAAALEVKPAWFPWSRFRNAEALVHYAGRSARRARATQRARGVPPARSPPSGNRCPPPGTTIGAGPSARSGKRPTRPGGMGGGKKDEGLRLLRAAADHEDAIDKHPVTPGALLPAREILADLLLESGAAEEALKEYEAVLRIAPRRFNATAGAARAADRAGDRTKARAWAMQLQEIAGRAETSRPDLEWARAYRTGK